MIHLRGFLCLAALAAASVPAAAVLGQGAAPVDVPITVTDHTNVARVATPVTGGIPFPKGYLKREDVSRLYLVDTAGRAVPFQTPAVMAQWADGSVRWALLDFTADVPASGSAAYRLRSSAETGAKPARVIEIAETPAAWVVDTGALKAVLSKSRGSFLEEAWVDANGDGRYDASEQVVKSPGEMFVDLDDAPPGATDDGVLEYTKEQKQFFGMEGGNWLRESKSKTSTRYLASTGDYRITLFRRGELHTVFRMEGMHRSAAGRQFAKYTVYLHFYAGKSFVRAMHTWIMTGDPGKNFIRRMGIRLPLASAPDAYAFGGEFERETAEGPTRGPSRVLSGRFAPGGEAYILSIGPDKYYHNMPPRTDGASVRAPNAPERKDLRVEYSVVADGREAARGFGASGWADFTDGKLGVAAGVRDFYREHPKEIGVRDGALMLYLWPDHGNRTLDLRRRHGDRDGYYNTAGNKARRVSPTPGSAVGVAKTTEVLFYFHAGGHEQAAVDAAFAGLDEPLLPFAGAEWNCATGVWGPLQPRDAGRRAEIENFIDVSFHWIYLGQREFSWYGMMDWGDSLLEYASVHWELPNWPPNRGLYSNWGYAGWSSEWDPGQFMLVQYFRSGRWEHFRYGEAKVRHERDVDGIYWETPDDGPHPKDNEGGKRLGGAHRHDQQHWGTYITGYAQPNIAIGHLYYLTGDERCLDAYRDIAQYHAYATSIEDEGRLTLAYIGEVLGEKKWQDLAIEKMNTSRDCRPSNADFGRGAVANMMALILFDISSENPDVRRKLIEWADACQPGAGQGSEAPIVLWSYLRAAEKSDRWDAKIRAAYALIIPKQTEGFTAAALPHGVWGLSLEQTERLYARCKSRVAEFAVYKPTGFFPIPCLGWAPDGAK